MQEGGPEAADATFTDGVRPPAAPYSCCRVPAHPQQQPQSAHPDQGNPGCSPWKPAGISQEHLLESGTRALEEDKGSLRCR